MKVNYNGIEIECTPEEFTRLVQISASSNDSIVIKPIDTKVVPSIINSVNNELDPRVAEYISYLYRAKPDRYTSLGRAPYMIQLLATGEVFSISKLMKLGRAHQYLVNNTIRRAIDGGCVFVVSGKTDKIDRHNISSVRFTKNTKIQLVQLGSPAEAKYARDFLSLRTVEAKKSANSL